MPLTPALDLPYLAAGDLPDLPTNNALLAQAVEDILSKKIQHGTVTITGTGVSTGSAAVTFVVPFAVAPVVLVTCVDWNSPTYIASAYNATTTGFTAWLASRSPSTTWSGSRNVSWIAMELG